MSLTTVIGPLHAERKLLSETTKTKADQGGLGLAVCFGIPTAQLASQHAKGLLTALGFAFMTGSIKRSTLHESVNMKQF